MAPLPTAPCAVIIAKLTSDWHERYPQSSRAPQVLCLVRPGQPYPWATVHPRGEKNGWAVAAHDIDHVLAVRFKGVGAAS